MSDDSEPISRKGRRPPSSKSLETVRKQTLFGQRRPDDRGKLLGDEEVRKRYAFIVNSSRDSMCAINPARRYEAVNDAFCELHGLSREVMSRLGSPEPWPSAVQHRVQHAVDQVFATREPAEERIWADLGEGPRCFIARWTPYSMEGDIKLVVESVRDDTERARLDERRAQAVRHLSLLSRASQRVLDVETPAAAAKIVAEELLSSLDLEFVRLWSAGPGAIEVWAEAGTSRLPLDISEVADAAQDRAPLRVGADALLIADSVGAGRFVVELHGGDPEVGIVRQVLSTLGPVILRATQRAELLRSRDDYRALFETAQDAILIIDPGTETILDANLSAAALYGYPREELVGRSQADLGVESRPGRRRVQKLGNSSDGLRYETQQRASSGEILHLDVSATMVEFQGRQAILSVNRDLTAGRRQQRQLQESERRFRDIMENVQAVAVLLDPGGRITYANPFLADLVGSAPYALEGLDWFATFIPEDQRSAAKRSFLDSLQSDHISAQFESEILAGGGRRHAVLWSATALHDEAGATVGSASFGVDITSRKRAEAELRHLALHDPLTACGNRTLLAEHLRTSAAIVLVDIDRFKTVNDSLGHPTGDRVLEKIAARLQRAAPEGALVARIGGDEFAVALDASGTSERAVRLAEALRAELARPYVIEGRTIHLATCFGVAAREAGGDGMDLMRDADIALAEAKRSAGAIALCEEAMRGRARERLDLEARLRQDIGTDRISVVYQPVVTLASGETAGFEALARWSPEGRDPVSPFRFIPIAEEAGLIEALGAQVLEQACVAIARLREASGRALTVNVNASARQLMSGRFIAEVERCLASVALPPHALKIEVTESQVLEDSPEVRATLASLRQMGVDICLDDFGTGYSSLRYLSRYPCDVVKVDRSFVAEAEQSGQHGILRAIVALSGALGARTVAEGVETSAQREMVASLGCTYGQGYLWARPQPLEDALANLQEAAD